MRILFVINQLGGGGAERVLTLIANHASQNVSNQVYIFSVNNVEKKYPIDESISVEEGNGYGGKTAKIIKAIREKIKCIEPDTVVAFEYHVNMKTIIATRGFSNTRVVVSERNNPAVKGGNFPLKQIRAILYRYADCLVCQTPDAKSFFSKAIQKRAIVIPNPISPDMPGSFKGNRKKKVVNFCRLEPQKNLYLLIDAFEQFRVKNEDYILEIYGDGSLKDDIKKYIKKKGLTDKIYIYPATSDIYERIIDAGMFVSSSDFEGLSNSMLEAMALGIPTICTDCPCGGARMTIRSGENGVLVPVRAVNEMSEAMDKIANDWNFATMIGANAMFVRERFNIKTIINEWMDVIQPKHEIGDEENVIKS